MADIGTGAAKGHWIRDITGYQWLVLFIAWAGWSLDITDFTLYTMVLRQALTELLGVYSRPDRDPRGHTISLVYVGHAQGTPRADDDAKTADLFTLDALPAPLAFDHAEILEDYRRYKRSGIRPGPWNCG